MRRNIFGVLLVVTMVLVGSASFAVEVPEAVVAAGVEDRAPVGEASTFSADVERVFAFTRVVGIEGEQTIRHIWYYAGRVMAEIELPVRSSNWRTWSSKTILPEWSGQWLVEVVGPDDKVLQQIPFTVQ